MSRRSLGWMCGCAAAMLLGVASFHAAASPGRYLDTDAFLEVVFGNAPGTAGSLILDAALRRKAEEVLGHRFARLRLEYWASRDTTAWIIDEVAKTEPVTVGVGVRDGRVTTVRILEFRESRGWEVRYPFFTDQFTGAELAARTELDRSIDGITGATLSVEAVQRVVRLTLLLDEHVRSNGQTTAAAAH